MLDSLQTEIDAMGWALPVHILGVNEIGQESGNPQIPPLGVLPWLQDDADQMAWASWHVGYRDVVILDEQNVEVATYNLTTFDLGTPVNFNNLKAVIATFAENGDASESGAGLPRGLPHRDGL